MSYDLAPLPEILKGWQRVHMGEAEQGDRRWSARLRAWIPVVKKDGFCGQPVGKLITIVIRRNGR